MTTQILTQKYLHQIFDYKDGNLYWKISLSRRVHIGDKAGCLDTNQYSKIKINGKSHGLHRVVYAWHYGYFPKIIDHIDGNPENNNIKNLREATQSQNNWNSKKNSRNTSGFKNVHWRKERNKWTCQFQVNKKTIIKGAFDTAEEASLFAEKLRKQLHGEFTSQF